MGGQEKLNVTLVKPEPVVEVGVDVARDASGSGGIPRTGTVRALASPPPADVPRLTSPPS
ncbi:ATP-dependent DNA ligase [Streptomyces sp. P9-1]|uniref:ATP-dependent DNA ligase n=1 Tax=Streptomyces sp. P9-1 TaxID=3422589 RepID=UPI003D3603A3